MKIAIEEGVPAPKPRTWEKRLTPELREMKPGQSVLVTVEVARSLMDYIRRQGWVGVQRKEDGSQRVWRIE
jgi:hypothetical protein